MKKHTAIAALAALACTAALAQTSTIEARNADIDPISAGGVAALHAENKVQERLARDHATPTDPAVGFGRVAPPADIDPSATRSTAAARADATVHSRLMDVDGDGVVANAEWDAYRANALNSLSPEGAGVTTAELDEINRTPTTAP